MAEFKSDDRELFAFCDQSADALLDVYEHRAEAEARPRIPRLDLARTKPPGEGWSFPPGALAASWDITRGSALDGERYLEVYMNEVYRFSRKARHRINPFLERWLAAQVGRPVT